MKTNAQIIIFAEDYVKNHLKKKKTPLSEIAKSVHLSDDHFHRINRAGASEGIHRFRSKIQLEWSAVLLETNSTLTITDIAIQYGYGESSSYCRALKKQFKTTPT